MFTIPDWFDKLGLMAWPLAICSIIAAAIAIERLLYFLRTATDDDANYHKMARFLDDNSHQPKALRDELIASRLLDLQDSYTSGLNWLRTIGSISPMIGLLGTVLGIIKAFKTISVQTGAVSPNLIADGLWEAMLTTAVGLCIAIPAILIGQLLAGIAEKRIAKLSHRLDNKSLAMALEATPKYGSSQAYNHSRQNSAAAQSAAAQSAAAQEAASPISGSPMERWQPS